MKTMTILFMALGLGIFIQACNESTTNTSEVQNEASTETAKVERGKYLVNSVGCQDCHTPKKMGPKGPEFNLELDLSGHQAGSVLPPLDTNVVKAGWILFSPDLTACVGPWGISYAANLTSDDSGIGAWTEEHFFNAIRHGKSKGLMANRELLPPMPWQVIRNLTDEDLKAIFAYLKSTKPVKNVVPAPTPPAGAPMM